MPVTEPVFLTTAEVAGLARVDVSTIQRWAKQGKLPSINPGGKSLRFRRADVEELLTPKPAEAAS